MKGVKKQNLPEKTCLTCGRPFTWRKKWEKNWIKFDTVRIGAVVKRTEK